MPDGADSSASRVTATTLLTLSSPIASDDCDTRRPVTVIWPSSSATGSCAWAALKAPAALAISNAARADRRMDERTDM